MTQQQLLLPGTARPADVLTMRVVEPQESQDGLSQPQSCHAPQRQLKTQVRDRDNSHMCKMKTLQGIQCADVQITDARVDM